MRVAMVTTHPIQYQVPWLQRLARRDGIELQVYFAMLPDATEQGREFGVSFAWDVPLLDGYDYKVLRNVARRPSLTEFSGCDTPAVRAEIRNGKYDAVIVNGWGSRTAVQALSAARLAGIPCVVRGEANGLRPRAAWKRMAHRALLSQYAAYLPIGTRNREYYRALGVPDAKMFLTPYCVDNERFAAGAAHWRERESRDSLRRRFGLDPEAVTFLFSGKFVGKKRPGDIIEAVRRVGANARAPIQVLMVGDGPLGQELRAASEGLPVRFSGFLNQSEITAAYVASDCLVLPSDSGETWGLVANEAMACALPAILSDQVGSAIDLVSSGKTGETFPCGDVAALAEAIRRMAGDRGKLQAMGAEAQRRVHSEYNFDRVVEGVLAALRSLPQPRH